MFELFETYAVVITRTFSAFRERPKVVTAAISTVKANTNPTRTARFLTRYNIKTGSTHSTLARIVNIPAVTQLVPLAIKL